MGASEKEEEREVSERSEEKQRWPEKGNEQVNLVYMFRQPETDAKAYLMQSSVARSSVQEKIDEKRREANQTRRSNEEKKGRRTDLPRVGLRDESSNLKTLDALLARVGRVVGGIDDG